MALDLKYFTENSRQLFLQIFHPFKEFETEKQVYFIQAHLFHQACLSFCHGGDGHAGCDAR